MNIKALTASSIVSLTIVGTIAPVPADAFWYDTQKTCEVNLIKAQNLRNSIYTDLGLPAPTWSGKVKATKNSVGATTIGGKLITNCITEFKAQGNTYIQGYAIEKKDNQTFVIAGSGILIRK